MIKQKSMVMNFIYNFLYTGLNLLFPLITAPYVSRVLGASNLGIVNFATVVVNWFILFATFGTTTYGIREIAKRRENIEQLNKIYTEIFVINGLFSIIITLIYYMVIISIDQFSTEFPLYIIMSLIIILNIFNIEWLYVGLEEYRFITIRSAIVKIISLICIFLFVRGENHYVVFGLVSVLATSFNGILNFFYSRKFVKLDFKRINPFRHIKYLFVFFLHTFIVNIYTSFDQILLGFLADSKSVAFMNRSRTIIAMAISVSYAISNVTLPRASYYLENDKERFKQLLTLAPNMILWITVPITVGCISLASDIMYILGGKEFVEATTLLQVLSLTILISPLAAYLQNQVLVPTGNEKYGLYSAFITSFLSFSLNLYLIPQIGYLGAGITQVISELTVICIRYYLSKSKLGFVEINFVNKSTISYFFSAIFMFLVIIYIRFVLENVIISLLLGVIIGATVYFLVLFLMKEKTTMLMVKAIKNQLLKS